MPTVSKHVPGKKPGGKVSAVDRIAPIGFDKSWGISILIYGQSGTGKTTLWSTFPGPILAIISSGSMRPGELRSADTPELRGKVDQVVLEHSSEIRQLVAHAKESTKYKTIVLDHVSGLQDLTLKEILGVEELPEQKSFNWTTRDTYAQSTMMCKEYLRALLNLVDKMNVVIVGQERSFNGPEDSPDPEMSFMTIGVGVTPALAAWLQPACDYCVQTFKRGRYEIVEVKIGDEIHKNRQRVKGIDFCIRTEPHDMIATKFRRPLSLGPLPDSIVNPTYAKIMKVIRGEPIE